jgi:hypothetical protein
MLFVFGLALPQGRQGKPKAAPASAGLKFEISFPASVHQEPMTGRVLVAITKNLSPEPQSQGMGYSPYFIGTNNNPFFAADVSQVKPDQTMVIDASSIGYPLDSLKDIPAGDYSVQALMNVYTEFKRADGHTIWAHMDQWEGQNMTRSPGNLYSDVQKVHLDPAEGFNVKLSLSKVIPPIQVPPDTQWVKRVKIQSDILTKWWGHPIYLGATAILPKGYDEHPEVNYPVIYWQGHFPQDVTFLFSAEETPETPQQRESRLTRGGVETPYEFYKQWIRDDFPRVIFVTWQHPTPFYDDSYAVNSANNGPFGDAIMNELIPHIETHFRIIRKPYARMLTGGSTGGWESLALQVFHPDFFCGTWTFNPDPIDFHSYVVTNIYEDDNAFYPPGSGWVLPERPYSREPKTGQVRSTMRQMSKEEAALGSHGRSGAQLDIWQAVYGPVGPDGYPKDIWDKLTGKIDHEVANYMRDNGYDLTDYVQKNWPTIGPRLKGKIRMWCGDMDNFYLNLAVYRLEAFLTKAVPPYEGTFTYGRPQIGHGWHPMSNADMVRTMAKQIAEKAPDWMYK